MFLGFWRNKSSFSTKNSLIICWLSIQNLLKIVEKPSSTSQNFDNHPERLNFFNTKLKISGFANISFANYQKPSFNDHSYILRNHYLEMSKKMSSWLSYTFASLVFMACSFCFFGDNFLIFKFYCSLGDQNVSLVPQNSFKTENLVSMTKPLTKNDQTFSTKIVTATFEKVCHNYRFFNARKSD